MNVVKIISCTVQHNSIKTYPLPFIIFIIKWWREKIWLKCGTLLAAMHNTKNHKTMIQTGNGKGMLVNGTYGHFQKWLTQNVLDQNHTVKASWPMHQKTSHPTQQFQLPDIAMFCQYYTNAKMNITDIVFLTLSRYQFFRIKNFTKIYVKKMIHAHTIEFLRQM